MRITVIAPPWYPVPPTGYGGIELVVALETEALVSRGHDVTLIASAGSTTRAHLHSPFDPPPPPDALGSVERGHAWFEAAHAADAYAVARAFEAEVIHDHSGIIGPVIGASVASPPVVHTLHGPWNPFSSDLYSRIHNRIHLVAISDRQRVENPHVRYAGLVYNGIDLAAYTVQPAKQDYLAYIGRANPEKVPDRTIKLARAAGMPLKMIIKRNEPAEQDYWNAKVAPLLGDDIEIFEGVSATEKDALLGAARAMLFPIQWPEPFGLVMAEALACGTPVVTCPAGAAPEIVAHEVTGIVASSDDALVKGLQRAWEGAFSADACRARVERMFSASTMAAGYERLFQQVCSGLVPDAPAGTGALTQ
ncbi:MAG: glycosyltransferase family 4 protein [Acidimicrobiia bacterium]